ncbi:MAG TPA: cupin domain-containing protein [Paucimonas sp.]|nr:cupin domain-containing protein [Paucimonas sp.]
MKTSFAQLMARLPGPASDRWPEGERFARGFAHGTMSVELYAPRGDDPQTPHRQDELYVIVQGEGEFLHDGMRQPCKSGDVLFVAAGVPHRFENFSPDFATWVVFWGPEGGER